MATKTATRTLSLIDTVDQLGSIKAQIAALTRQESKLKDILKASGQTEIDGLTFRATVSTSIRETLDMDAVRAKLSPQFISAHTNETEVVAVRVVAQVRAD